MRVVRTSRSRVVAVLAGLVAVAGLPAAASAAVPGDDPAGALPYVSATAENGPITDLQRTLTLAGAGPDAGAPRCLGPASFERTAWLSVEAASVPRRISLEAAAKDGSTATPDLAAYVQDDARGTDVHEPQGCSGRETEGDPARGDEGASVVLAVPAGKRVLVQVGWRAGDPAVPVVASLATTTLPARAAPAGQAFAGAPIVARYRGYGVPLAGARTLFGDPAQPRCASQAGVWRRVRIARKGVYAVGAAGADTESVTVFSTLPSGDTALACADDGFAPALTTTFRAKRRGTYWLRVGGDGTAATAGAGLAIVGPYRTARAGRAALPAAFDRATRIVNPAARCTDARRPTPILDDAVVTGLRRGGRRVRGVTDGSSCVGGRSTVGRVRVAVARVRRGRCAWLVGRTFGRPRSCRTPVGARRAAGVDPWRITLRRALPRGARYRVVVRAQVRRKGRLRNGGRAVVTSVRR